MSKSSKKRAKELKEAIKEAKQNAKYQNPQKTSIDWAKAIKEHEKELKKLT